MKNIFKILLLVIVVCLGAVIFSACTGCKENRAYSLIYTAGEGGSIEGDVCQTVHNGESGTEVVAVAGDGFEFVQWSDGVTTQARTDKNISHDINVTARFAKTEYFTITYEADEGGRIDGLAKQTVKNGESGQEVTAVPNEGYTFVKWSDGLTENKRTEKDVTTNFWVKAIFEQNVYTVTYNLIYGGWLLEGQKQYDEPITVKIAHGSDSITVVAKPYFYHVFMGWSDGVTTEERADKNITSDMTVTAYFGCEAKYLVNKSIGGKIEGRVEQTVRAKEQFAEVKAVPDDGYIFTGWSDLKAENVRQDTADYSLEMVAYFEPIEKTFKYNYGELAAPLENTVTLNRNNLQSVHFAVPSMHGYDFCGWFTDKTYTTKVVDEDGVYMLGYRSFALETDTLYAKWQKSGEQKLKNSVLLVFIGEIDATLYSTVAGKDIEVKHKLTGVEYELCSLIALKMSEYLNEWFKDFEDTIKFEVDSYYTVTPINENSIVSYKSEGNLTYHINAYDIPEVAVSGIDKNYISVIASETFGKDRRLLCQTAGGTSQDKYGYVYRELTVLYSGLSYHTIVEEMKNGNLGHNAQSFLSRHMDWLIYTCENYFDSDQIFSYSTVKSFYFHNDTMTDLQVAKLYLLNKAQIAHNGEFGGIPAEFWRHGFLPRATYLCNRVGERAAGKIIDSDGKTITTEFVAYGSELVVEAVPNKGYRFVRWSDGITTPIRVDKNIVSWIRIQAIFIEDN